MCSYKSIYSHIVVYYLSDMPTPGEVRAEVTTDNTSIRVSWQWSRRGVPMCVDLVNVLYQPKGGSLMMYTVDSTTATHATLPKLQCDTKYTVCGVWVYVESGSNRTVNISAPRRVTIPARGSYMYATVTVCTIIPPQRLPLPLRLLLSSRMPQVSG